jgi:hypothetical protein
LPPPLFLFPRCFIEQRCKTRSFPANVHAANVRARTHLLLVLWFMPPRPRGRAIPLCLRIRLIPGGSSRPPAQIYIPALAVARVDLRSGESAMPHSSPMCRPRINARNTRIVRATYARMQPRHAGYTRGLSLVLPAR